VIERHITLDRSMPGSDQKASLEPDQLRRLINQIDAMRRDPEWLSSFVSPERQALLLGDGVKRVLPSEGPVMKKLRRVEDF
jgi:N-acetylneuraminate synthase